MSSCTKKDNLDQSTLRIHFPSVKLNIDPQKMEDAFSMAIASQLYRGLLRYDASGDIRPDLAESWIISEDHKVFRFKLRKSTFSNGSLITAKHVQMTFARLFRLGSSMAGDIDYIAGAKKFKETLDLTDFEVTPISESEIEFKLATPSAIFLKQLAVADCAILPIDDFRKDPDTSAAGAFSGPYKIVQDFKDLKMTIEKWRRDALDSSNPPQKINYSMIEGKPYEIALNDEVDTLDHYKIDSDQKSQLEKLGWTQAATELAGEIFVVLDPKRIPLEVRKNLYSSVNSSEVVESFGKKDFRAAYGLIPFGLFGVLEASDVKELQLPITKNTKKISIEMDYEKDSAMEEHAVQFLKKKWEPLSVDLKLNPLSKKEKLTRLFGKSSQAILAKKSMDYPDGFSVLGYFKGNYESNYFYVQDAKIDEGLSKVVQIFDNEKRTSEYKRIQLEILKHYTIIPMFFGSEASGFWSKKVKAVPIHSLGIHMLPLESVEMSKD